MRLAFCIGEAGHVLLGPFIFQLGARGSEIDALGDVGYQIAHTLDILGHKQQMSRRGDVARVFHHVGQQFAKQAIVQFVHVLIGGPDGLSLGRVKFDIGGQHARQHLLNQFRHARYTTGRGHRR